MDVKGILDKIEQDARDAAKQTLDEAKKRADELAGASRQKIDRQRADMEKRLTADAAETAERMGRMAELEDKKAMLAVKRSVMDGAFDETRRLLLALPRDKARAFFMEEITKTARGGETLSIGEENPDWFDDSFLSEVNAALTARGEKPLTLSDARVPGRGFRLLRGGASMDCTFASLVEEKRLTLESQVASALFA